jgi:hypothetical protein
MAKTWQQSEISAQRFGGKACDYLAIHQLIDASSSIIADHRHRALTHNTWFLNVILERVFGAAIINSEGCAISVRAIGQVHLLTDFGGRFIPTAQDYLQHLAYQPWMAGNVNDYLPPSCTQILPAFISSCYFQD